MTFYKILLIFLNALKNTKFNQYFFSLIPNFEKNNSKDEKKKIYKQLLVAEYICECILFIKEDLFESEKDCINYDEKKYINQFNNIFYEEENMVELSIVRMKKEKKKYILFSFLGSLYKYYKNALDIY